MFGGPVWHCDHLIGEAGGIAFCWFVTCFIVYLLLLLVLLVGKLVCDTFTDYHSLFALPLGVIGSYLICDTSTDYHSLFALPLGVVGRQIGL